MEGGKGREGKGGSEGGRMRFYFTLLDLFLKFNIESC